MSDEKLPRTIEEWIASYHEPDGVITRFVKEQLKEPNGEPVDDTDKQIVTELIERVLPHFDTWMKEVSGSDKNVRSCSAGVDLMCGIMLSRMVRLSVENPMNYPNMAVLHIQGITQTLKLLMQIAMHDDLSSVIGDVSTDEGMKRLLELVSGAHN